MKICLVMVVKNEAHVIERALRSAKPLIDSYFVVDTGSTDDTKALIEKTLFGKAGVVVDLPWEGFGKTKTLALSAARGWLSTRTSTLEDAYFLLLDADDFFGTADGAALRRCNGVHPLADLRHDLYELEVNHDVLRYRQPRLLRAPLPWRFVGRTHEFLDCNYPFTSGFLEGVHYVVTQDGARRKDAVKKSAENIEALRLDIHENPINKPRWVFYLAQEYKEAGDLKAARAVYLERADMQEGWDEERWAARFEEGLLTERLGHPNQAVSAYLDAFELRPWRAEPLVAVARCSRASGDYHRALVTARAASHTPMPTGERFFLNQEYYGWRRSQELGLALHNTGQHQAALEVFVKMLEEQLPDDVLEQTKKNIAFCEAALRGGATSMTT
jgi:glycosyltransferase involved in cell wall biosynthesis